MNNEEEIISDVEKLTYEVLVEDNLNNWDDMSPSEKASMMKNLLDIIEDKNKKIDQLENHIYYKNCIACGKEFKAKRKDAKYCVCCSKSITNRTYYLSLTEEQKQKRREQSKLCMRRIREERKKTNE